MNNLRHPLRFLKEWEEGEDVGLPTFLFLVTLMAVVWVPFCLLLAFLAFELVYGVMFVLQHFLVLPFYRWFFNHL